MTEIPNNVDLGWIARNLIEGREEMRAFRDETRAELKSLRDDVNVLAWSVMRIERGVNALRDEVQRLWLAHGDLRRRIEHLEGLGQ